MLLEDTMRKILIESPLYTEFLTADYFIKAKNDLDLDVDVIEIIKSGKVQFDCFCIFCKKEATFIRGAKSSINTYSTHITAAENTFIVKMVCQRAKHSYYIWLENTYDGIKKIGMSPSMEDISNFDVNKYKGILQRKYLSELHRAGGLASHGIGIGSFVYMRRIFEKQINDHYDRRVLAEGEIENFSSLRTPEKIKAIENYLPATLVKHRDVYSILSKGIHELDEETCLKFYPVLKQAIVMILEQDHQIKLEDKARDDLEKSLAEIMKDL